MKSYPPIPHADAVDCFESGHLWLLEKIDGALLRFRLHESGVIEFGDADRVYQSPDDLPAQYRHAVRHIRVSLDRQALRAAVDDIEEIVFFGEATQYRGTVYDWDRTPSFLGFDVWSADTEQFRPPDAVDGIFRRLNLHPVNAVEQEVHARDFNPEGYDNPHSAWYDGPAAGIVIRDKQGHRAQLPVVATEDAVAVSTDVTAADLVDEYATDQRFESLAATMADIGRPLTVDALYERTLEAIFRATDPAIFESGVVDRRRLREAVAARARQFCDSR